MTLISAQAQTHDRILRQTSKAREVVIARHSVSDIRNHPCTPTYSRNDPRAVESTNKRCIRVAISTRSPMFPRGFSNARLRAMSARYLRNARSNLPEMEERRKVQ